MDRIRVSEALDTGSIPVGGTKWILILLGGGTEKSLCFPMKAGAFFYAVE